MRFQYVLIETIVFHSFQMLFIVTGKVSGLRLIVFLCIILLYFEKNCSTEVYLYENGDKPMQIHIILLNLISREKKNGCLNAFKRVTQTRLN